MTHSVPESGLVSLCVVAGKPGSARGWHPFARDRIGPRLRGEGQADSVKTGGFTKPPMRCSEAFFRPFR